MSLDADGDFVVAWESFGQDGSDRGIFAQRFKIPAVLDIDGNGATAALTDGLLVLRYLFGFTGATLTAGPSTWSTARAATPLRSRVSADTDLAGPALARGESDACAQVVPAPGGTRHAATRRGL